MIKLLFDTTIAGIRHGAGSILNFPHAIETGLIDEGDAIIVKIQELIEQKYIAVSRSSINAAGDASYSTLASITIPGGTMGLNSRLLIIVEWSYTNSVSTKTLAADFGGVAVAASTGTTSEAFKSQIDIQNMNSLAIQKTHNTHTFGSAGARLSGTVNTEVDAILDLKCKWGAGVLSETITLIGYSITHCPGS